MSLLCLRFNQSFYFVEVITERTRTHLELVVKLLALVYVHFDSKSLNEHVDCLVIVKDEWHDHI